MHLAVTPSLTFNFDETALYISILPRKTYGSVRTAGRKIAKQRLTVGFLVNADGTRVFKPLVISKSKRPHDFRPDYNPEEYVYWRHNAKGWMTSNVSHKPSAYTVNPLLVAHGVPPARLGTLPPSRGSNPAEQRRTNLDGADGTEIGLDEEVNDVGLLIDRLCLGPSALSAEAFVWIDDNQPTCAEPGEDPLAREPLPRDAAAMWEAPATMQQVYDDSNPASREARRTARAACEMLIGYAWATCITPRDLCALFDIRNPIIVARMECASPALDLNNPPPPPPPPPPPAMTHADTPPPETPRRRGRVLPAWMHVPTPDWVAQTARRQELIDAGAPALMSGYLAAAEWMRL
ncbi:unnamed protein product [Closterium sp. Yama58-4]|nr:unnamed protein product [Closterium sp. Yama58-4]